MGEEYTMISILKDIYIVREKYEKYSILYSGIFFF